MSYSSDASCAPSGEDHIADASQTASNFTESLEILLDAYEQIGEQLPLLQEYESLFDHSPHMLQALELMYIDILDFHQDALRFFSGKRKRPSPCAEYALTSLSMEEIHSVNLEGLWDQVQWHSEESWSP
jgi:hypothetical protein